MMARRIPWEEIRLAYVQGVEREGRRVYPSQRDLATEYSIDPGEIGRRAKKENWSAQRDIFVSKLSAETQQKTIEAVSDDAADFNLLTFRIAREALERIKERMREPLTEDAANKLSSALKNYQHAGRLALGESTDSTRVTGDITTMTPAERQARIDELIAKRGG